MKYAGTVIITSVIGVPIRFSASETSFLMIWAATYSGGYDSLPIRTLWSVPIYLLIDATVRSGFAMMLRFAALPTTTSPPSLKYTADGVTRSFSLFSMIVGSSNSINAIPEFVVPKSIPITSFCMLYHLSSAPELCGYCKWDFFLFSSSMSSSTSLMPPHFNLV